MQRLWAALVLGLLITSLCVLGLTSLKKYGELTIGLLEQAEAAVDQGDIEAAIRLSDELEQMWIKAEKRLSVYMNRTQLFEIGADISELKPKLQDGETGEFKALCRSITVKIKHIQNMENG